MTESNHIPVFYEGQDDLIEILATSMVSICYTTKSFIDFYILDCGICEFNKMLLESMKEKFSNFSIEFIPIDLKQFEGLKGYTDKNYIDCYSRLLIPELKPEIDKAIYLDADVIALNDIKLLWNEDLNGYEIAACADLGYQKSVQDRCFSIGIPRDQIYCNAGVLIIDCNTWRKNNISKKLLHLAKEIKDKILYICEDILNLYYKNNNYKLLDLRYNIHQLENFICSVCAPQITDEYISNEWKNIVIQHLSPAKPWREGEYNNVDLKHWSEFWFFAKLTPYYDGLSLKFLNNSNKRMLGISLSVLGQENKETNKRIKYFLFNFIPFVQTKQKGNVKRVYLFGFIPIFKIKSK